MTVIEQLSIEFSEMLKMELGPEKFKKMVRRHLDEEYVLKDICVTHEVCDPNVTMMDAFKHVMKHEPELLNDGHMAVINAAWALAKTNNFYYGSFRK